MLEDLEDALDAAVLAERPVQRVEGDVGPQLGEHLGDVAADIDARDAVASASSASAQALPDESDTGRSLDQPPIRTATCFDMTPPLR